MGHVCERDVGQREDGQEDLQKEERTIDLLQVECDQTGDEAARHLEAGVRHRPGEQGDAHGGEEENEVEAVLRRCIVAQIRVVESPVEQPDPAEQRQTEGDGAEDRGDPGGQRQQPRIGRHASELGDCADHEQGHQTEGQVQTEVEGEGDPPKATVVLPERLQEQHLRDHHRELAYPRDLSRLLPPVQLLQIASTVRSSPAAFVGNRVELPAEVLRVVPVGCDAFQDAHKEDGQRQIGE